MSDITMPGGHKLNKKVLFVGLGGAALIGGYVILKRRNSAAAVPASTDTSGDTTDDGSDPSLGYDNGLDPYGDSTGVADGYYDPTTGQYIGTGVGSVLPPTVTQVSTNAAWAQECEALLTQEGFDPVTVAAALGKYLTGGSLTSAQEGIVQAAIGLEGPPPMPVPPGPPPNPNQHKEPKTKTVTANGKQTLYQIATANGITEGKLVGMNLQLARFVGTKKNLPKGTKVKV